MQTLRQYQITAVANVHTKWQTGSRRVLLVAPTGAGKTLLAEQLIYREHVAGGRVVFIVHRRELLQQAAVRLRKRFGDLEVGIIAPGEDWEPCAFVQVATVQTLLSRSQRPEATLIVFDEAHHYLAELWAKLHRHYSAARILGLTATPERQDGKPLGDMFDDMVVAASYSELVADGFLVPCRVYQPPEVMGSDLAQDPLVAYQRYGEGARAFVFTSSVEAAYEQAKRFTAAGIPSGTIEAKTPKGERDETMRRFASGEIQCLMNVAVLTEGIDVPSARCIVLARNCAHVGTYLQIAGRVLRPCPGKTDALIIDLTGATLIHGMPTEDRIYSLEGEGIKRTSLAPLKNCAKCSATLLSVLPVCPVCGYEFPREPVRQPKIYDMELRAVFAGSATPITAQQRELGRLLRLAREKDWHLYFVIKSFKELFGRDPKDEMAALPLDEKRYWFTHMKEAGLRKGRSINQVRGLYKATFGAWPDWNWR